MRVDMIFEELDWNFDAAAVGPRREDARPRLRAWVKSDTGEPAELVAYTEDAGPDAGLWYLCFPRRQYQPVAQGREKDISSAQRRVFNVWVAMR